MRFDQKQPSIIVYNDGRSIRAEDNTNRSRTLGSADPTSVSAVDTLIDTCITRLTAISGGHIHFGAGSFLHQHKLTFPANTWVSGEGREKTILDCRQAADALGPSIQLSSGCAFSDLQILGSQLRTKNQGGLAVDTAANVNIQRIKILASWGIRVMASHDVVINDYIGGGHYGAVGAEINNFLLFDSDDTYNCRATNLYCDGADRFCEIQDGAHDIYVAHGTAKNIDNTVLGSTARFQSYSLDVHSDEDPGNPGTQYPASHDVIYENILLDACYRMPGVGNWGAAAYNCYNVYYKNIHVLNPSLLNPSGSFLLKGTNCAVIDCDLAGGKYDSAGVYADIWVDTQSLDCSIIRCKINNAQSSCAIHLKGARSVVRDTVFNAAGTTGATGGIVVRAEAAGSIVEGCKCILATTGSGINLYAADNATIRDNWLVGGCTQGDIWLQSSPANCRVIGNKILSGSLRIRGSGTISGSNIIEGNSGQLWPGEVRFLKGAINEKVQDSFNSVDNPFGQNVALLSLDIYVATGATATSPNIDCGIGSSQTTDYTNLFDDLPGETIGLYNSKVATPGTQTQPILWQTGAGNRYLNMSIKDAAATGMVATYVATVLGL